MPTIGVRELARRTSAIIDEISENREPALITKRGRPVAYVVPVDPDEYEDWVLANAPEFVKSLREADRDVRKGRTVSLDEFEASLED